MLLRGLHADELRAARRRGDGAGAEAARLPRAARPRRAATATAASRVYIVSSTLQEIVDALADELGFDGALGTVCEVEDGAYTGRPLRSLPRRGRRPRRCASSPTREGIDLAASTAYSDSHTDLPFLEAVGNPVAVNPDRDAPPDRARARLAGARVRASRSSRPPGGRSARRCSGSRSSSAPPSGPPDGVQPESAGSAALGFAEARRAGARRPLRRRRAARQARPRLLADRVAGDARRPRSHGQAGARGLGGRLRALGGARRARLPRRSTPSSARSSSRRPRRARVVVAAGCLPDRAFSATGCGGSPRPASSPLLTATSPARLPHPDGGPPLAGTNPLAIGIPSSDGAPLVADVSMGKVTYGDVLRGAARPEELVPFGGDQAHKAFALAVGLQALVEALAGEERRRRAGRRAARGRPGARRTRPCAGGVRLPGDS